MQELEQKVSRMRRLLEAICKDFEPEDADFGEVRVDLINEARAELGLESIKVDEGSKDDNGEEPATEDDSVVPVRIEEDDDDEVEETEDSEVTEDTADGGE